METFKVWRFEVRDRDGDAGPERFVYWTMEDPETEGASWSTSFYFSASQWAAFVASAGAPLQDGVHLLCMPYGDVVQMVDLDGIGIGLGASRMRWYSFTFPVAARREVAALIAAASSGRTIEIPRQTRRAWVSAYGQGEGTVRVVWGEGARALYESYVADAAHARLKELLGTWDRIARNSTQGAASEAVLRVSKDGDGFYVEARRPSGSLIMNGGWINHARDGEPPSWSSHT